MPATPERSGQEILLAFDYGRRRIGVAVGQSITGSATAIGAAPDAVVPMARLEDHYMPSQEMIRKAYEKVMRY